MTTAVQTTAALSIQNAKAAAKKRALLSAAASVWTRSTLTALSGK